MTFLQRLALPLFILACFVLSPPATLAYPVSYSCNYPATVNINQWYEINIGYRNGYYYDWIEVILRRNGSYFKSTLDTPYGSLSATATETTTPGSDYDVEITELSDPSRLHEYDWYYDRFFVRAIIPNTAPSIDWESAPSTVYAGQPITMRARASDTTGNLAAILMDLNGSPHRHDGFSGGLVGNGSDAYLDSYTFTAGLPGSTYLFTAKARDSDGAESGVISHAIVVANRAPTLQMTVNGSAIAGGQSLDLGQSNGGTLSFSFMASDPDGNYQRTRLCVSSDSGANWQEIYNSTAPSGTFNYDINSIGSYIFRADAIDASGSDSGFAILNYSSQNRAPGPSTLTATKTAMYVGETTTLTATLADADGNMDRHGIWWDRGIPGSSWVHPQVDWGVPPDGTGWSNISTQNLTPSNPFNSTITANWTPKSRGTYRFHCAGGDSAGAWGGGAEITIVVSDIPDTQPPSTPSGLTADNIGATGFNLSWNPSTDDSRVTGYEILRDGTVVGAANDTFYTLTGLTPLTSYEISVRAMDAAGNMSASSAPLSITTLPPPPPVLPLDWANQYNINPNDTLGSAANDGLSNYAKYNLGFNPGIARPGASTFDNTIPAQWHTMVAAKSGVSEAVGATNGSLFVDKNGAATYTIPIFAVPGTNGMQPEISLAYNSQSAGGIAGYGWSLTGLSAITRGGKTFKHDGVVRGMDYSLEDQYYLDGQRLIHVGGNPHGTAGAEYRLEHENFTRIVAQGAAGQGPESFKVWTKAGRVLEYGGMADARLYANSANHALEVQTWAANRITDTSGNYITFTYDNIAATGEQYLKQVDYTGNAGAGVSPYALLEFVYEPDPDSTMGYVHGSKFSRNKRLASITSKYGNNTVRSYALAYNAHVVGEPPRSLLLQVTETGADGTSFPPLTFTYSNPPAGFEILDANTWAPPEFLARALPNSGDLYMDKRNRFIDLNGDGYPDFIGAYSWDNSIKTSTYEIWMNKPAGWEKRIYVSPEYSVTHPNLPISSDGHGCFVDINSDGLVDIVSNAGTVFLNNANGENFVLSEEWSIHNWPPVVPPASAFDVIYAPTRCRVIDLNGDGRLDIMLEMYLEYMKPNPAYTGGSHYPPGGIYPEDEPQYLRETATKWEAFLNVGEGAVADHGNVWQYSPEYSESTFSNDAYFVGPYQMIDVNGDGLPDMVADQVTSSINSLIPNSTYWSRTSYMRLNTGTGWGQKLSASQSSVYPVLTGTSPFHTPEPFTVKRSLELIDHVTEALDFNGDGLIDMIRGNNFGSNYPPVTANKAWLNTGNGWMPAPIGFLSPYELSAAVNADNAATNGIVFIDVNNDGRIDLTRSRGNDRSVHLNTGVGWGMDTGGYHLPAFSAFCTGTTISGFQTWRGGTSEFIDLDANGAVDQIWNLELGEWVITWSDAYGYTTGAYNYTTVSKGAALNKRVHPDRLTAVTNGTGITSTITYAPLTERDANGNTTVYQKDFTPADPLDPDPVKNVIGPIYVVKNITHSTPASDTDNAYGNYALEYRYGHMRSHRLHGSLGFGWMSVTDTRTGITTTTRYSQEYPTIGKVIQTTAATANGTTLSDITTLHGIKPLNNGLNRFTFAAEIESRSWGLDGTLLSHTVTINDRTGDGSDYDDYGNPLRTETISGEGNDIITSVTTKTYSNTTANGAWLLGRCLTDQTTTTQGASSLTRANSYTYYPVTGLLHTEAIEPENAALSLTTTHTYDDFGNRVSTMLGGAGIASRTSSVQYDTAGRFPISTTNPLGHTTTTAYTGILNQALGLPSSATDPNNLTTSWTCDGFGRLTAETRPDGTTTTTSYLLRAELTSGAPSKAWCLLQGERPCRARLVSRPYQVLALLRNWK